MTERLLARLPVIAVVACLLAIAGCEQAAVRTVRELAARGEPLPPDGLQAEVTFCRRVGSKAGKRIGRGDVFRAEESSRVFGLVDFRNVPVGRTHSVHLVWIRPDGRELFRKYAEVTLAPADEGFAARINWKKAEDLRYLRAETEDVPEAAFTLDTSIDTSLARERDPGLYLLRVYLNRELLLEERFELRTS